MKLFPAAAREICRKAPDTALALALAVGTGAVAWRDPAMAASLAAALWGVRETFRMQMLGTFARDREAGASLMGASALHLGAAFLPLASTTYPELADRLVLSGTFAGSCAALFGFARFGFGVRIKEGLKLYTGNVFNKMVEWRALPRRPMPPPAPLTGPSLPKPAY